MKIPKTILAAALMFFSLQAAAGNEGANGGDEMALDFVRSADTALTNMSKAAKTPQEHAVILKIRTVGSKIAVMTTMEDLVVERLGFIQNSVATNDPSKNLIRINRYLWKQIRDDRLKEALALHEYASLAGFETTGSYELSSRYLYSTGFQTRNADASLIAPVCGAIETGMLLRVQDEVNVGEKTRTDVAAAGVRLQKALFKCAAITKAQFCQNALPAVDYWVLGRIEESKVGQVTQDEVDLARIEQEDIINQCR